MAAKKEPRNATTARSGQRYYSWRDEKFWSVTTIIGSGCPKPALLPWGIKATAEYAVKNLHILQQLVADDTEGAIQWLKGAPYRDRDRAADLGTQVHAAAEAHRLGRPMPDWPIEVKTRMRAFEQWLTDFTPEFEVVEAPVFNRREHYAGTLDAIVTVAGQRLVLDYKSSRTGIYPEVALQLAGYRHAEFIAMPDGTEQPMPAVDGAAALWLAPDGHYEFIPVRADHDVFRAFLFCREVFRWLEVTSKNVLGSPSQPSLALAMPGLADTAASLQGLRDTEVN